MPLSRRITYHSLLPQSGSGKAKNCVYTAGRGGMDRKDGAVVKKVERLVRKYPSASTEEAGWIWHYFKTIPNRRYFEWPDDLIEYGDDEPGPPVNNGLVFLQYPRPAAQSTLYELLRTRGAGENLDWRKAEIKRGAAAFLATLSELHNSGYRYCDFDPKNIFYRCDEQGQMYFHFGFNRWIGRVREFRGDTWVIGNDSWAGPKKVPEPDFLPPWYRDGVGFDDCYSAAAILFRMFIGLMPYQGGHLDGVTQMGSAGLMTQELDTDIQAHREAMEIHRTHPEFIFREGVTLKDLWYGGREKIYWDRWFSLPDRIKQLFREAFTMPLDAKYQLAEYNIQALSRKQHTPAEWLEELKNAKVIL